MIKILSYNISYCKQSKIDWILSHKDVDVFVIPECGDDKHVAIPEDYDFYWMGEYGIKGLGVIAPKNRNTHLAPWYNPTLHYALPIIMGDYLILAFWPTILNKKTDKYVDIALNIVNQYESYLSQYRTVIIGDYNIFSSRNKSQQGHKPSLLFDKLESLGYYSAYHTTTGDPFGKETIPTYYHQYKEDMSFFIDYAFTNVVPTSYRILTWDESDRQSDHVPQIIEI